MEELVANAKVLNNSEYALKSARVVQSFYWSTSDSLANGVERQAFNSFEDGMSAMIDSCKKVYEEQLQTATKRHIAAGWEVQSHSIAINGDADNLEIVLNLIETPARRDVRVKSEEEKRLIIAKKAEEKLRKAALKQPDATSTRSKIRIPVKKTAAQLRNLNWYDREKYNEEHADFARFKAALKKYGLTVNEQIP